MLVEVIRVRKEDNLHEERDWNQGSEEDTERKSHLWLVDALVLLRKSDDGRIARLGYESNAHEITDSDTQVCETGDFGRPAIRLDEDGCDGGEEEEQQAEEEGHVE